MISLGSPASPPSPDGAGADAAPLTNTLDIGRAVLAAALDLLDKPRDLYSTASEHARKLLNKAIFTRLYLYTGPAHPTVTTDEFHEPFGSLIHAIRTTDTGPTTIRPPQRPAGP